MNNISKVLIEFKDIKKEIYYNIFILGFIHN
jgi:hypothetical protein